MTEVETPSTEPPAPGSHTKGARAVGGVISRAHSARPLRALVYLLVSGLVLIAAARAGRLYLGAFQAHLDTRSVPYDFATFLRASSELWSGRSPYYLQGDATYAYPPFLAVLVHPFQWLPPGIAALIWMTASLVAIGAALWLLGVRDWRCYALAADYPFVKSAVLTGAVTPFLLLCAAAAWRWRATVLRSGGAVAAGVAMKLFLWPLIAWGVLLGRLRAALLGAGLVVALACVPWAAFGFVGLAEYPALLRDLSRLLADQSFSLFATFSRVGFSENSAALLSLSVALLLLAGAVPVARDRRRSERERSGAVLSLSIAAALAASPIVWLHYFVLLLVPLALARPRLSMLWLVPLAFRWLADTAWAYGNLRELGAALLLTAIVIAPAVAHRLQSPAFSLDQLFRKKLDGG